MFGNYFPERGLSKKENPQKNTRGQVEARYWKIRKVGTLEEAREEARGGEGWKGSLVDEAIEKQKDASTGMD